MQPSNVNPFGPADLAKMNQLLQHCTDTRCVLEKLRQMGLPTDQLDEANNAHENLAATGKRLFFPDQP